MLIACWSSKGGSGTTVIAASLALLLARNRAGGAVAVDLAGDLPHALGFAGSAGPGVAEWLAHGERTPGMLAAIEDEVTPGLSLVRRGNGPLDHRGASLLASVLAADVRPVVADCGVVGEEPSVGEALAAGATRSLLVLRPCYLAVRRAATVPLRPTGIVLLAEEHRALDAADVAGAVGAPVIAQVAVCPEVARSVDAGLLATRLPQPLRRVLAHAAA